MRERDSELQRDAGKVLEQPVVDVAGDAGALGEGGLVAGLDGAAQATVRTPPVVNVRQQTVPADEPTVGA